MCEFEERELAEWNSIWCFLEWIRKMTPPPVVVDVSQVYNRREVFGLVVRYFVSGHY